MTQTESFSLGRLEEYNGTIPWNLYTEKIEFYFSANHIEDDRQKKNILLSCVGTSTFAVLRDIIVPETLKEIQYKALLKKANEHFSPQPSEIVERFKFQKRIRKPGEPINDFVRDLRSLSEFCNFGATLNERLRDQLVFGIQEDRVQQKLLDTKELTIQKAIDIALSFESAEAGVKSLQINGTVNKLSSFRNERGKNAQNQNFGKIKPCFRCSRWHNPKDCPFKNSECFGCKNIGHVLKCCKSKNILRDKEKLQNYFEKPKNNYFEKPKHNYEKPKNSYEKPKNIFYEKPEKNKIKTVQEYSLNFMNESEVNNVAWGKTIKINGVELYFEIDSGAAHTIVSKNIADKLFSGKLPLVKSNVKLQTYSKHSLNVLGELNVDVFIENICIPKLKMIVIKEEGPSLIGKTWLKTSKLFWPNVNMISCLSKDDLIRKFPDVFTDGIGTIKGPPVSIKLKADVKPVFLKARTVPFSLRKATDLELERLTNEGIIKPVDYSDWATPVVIVPKSNGSVRICGDYRATVNACTEDDTYPLPRMEELFAKLSGAKFFTVFDLKDAYLQQPVDSETSKILTINTHKGLFNVLRLSFGVKSAPGIFQRKIENILKKFDYVGVFLDDVIISARTESEHSERVECILKCFSSHGIKLNKEKFKFMVSEVNYLGHNISQEGIKPIPEKVEAIMNAPSPNNVSQLRSFLGLISYYRSFLPNIADILEPLHRLLDNNVKWLWTNVHEKAFQKIKVMLCNSPILELYDINKEIVLSCDASEYGIGCVLSHIIEGKEKPICYASRTMNKTERNYAMIDKEALSVMFGVTKFHQYLAGRCFKIITDHKPLLRLFNPVKKIPDTLSPRMLRWSLMLSGYDYTIEYREGKNNKNADALSRLPLPVTVTEVSNPHEIMFVSNNADWPVTSQTIAKWTCENPVTKQILEWVLYGWPNKNILVEYEPYFRRRDEISCLENCLLWGHRVIIPDEGREYMLKLLHSVHQGICSMKAKARGVIWWPNMDKEIEQMVNSCNRCQMFARDNPKMKPLNWESELPWQRIHIDFAGPFLGKFFLIVVDSYTKWLEVEIVRNIDSITTIKVMRKIFATFGLPIELVSDNGPAFISDEFEKFLRLNGIKHTLTPPYSPSSNGQAERYVQTVKNCLKKLEHKDIKLSVSRFLLENHTTPHSVTGKTPAELMFGRSLRTALHLVLPQKSKTTQPFHNYTLNESVFVRNYGKGEKWMMGKIIKFLGSRWVLVSRSDGVCCKRHVNQLRHNRLSAGKMIVKENVTESQNYKGNTLNDRYDGHTERLSEGKVNISSKSENESLMNSDKSQFSRANVTDTVMNKDIISETVVNKYNNKTLDYTQNDKTVANEDVDLKKTDQQVRRSSRSTKPVVRLNYEGRGVISRK